MKKTLSIFTYLATIQRSDKLLIAATVVAALRLMLINSVFINFDIHQWAWFGPAEVWSGIAFAILEGVALAYVSKRWRKLRPKDITDWIYWSILLAGQLVLLISIVWVTAYAAASVRRGIAIDDLLGETGAVWWSMMVAAINPLIVILIGIVDDDQEQGPQAKPFAARRVRLAQAGALLERWEQGNGTKTPTVAWLRGEFTEAVGNELPSMDADEAIVGWRVAQGISGRRPAEPERNGVGRMQAKPVTSTGRNRATQFDNSSVID